MALVRVLLVESDEATARLTARALCQTADVRCEPSAQAARAALIETRFALGIVASRLADGCGLSFTTWLRANFPLLPLLIVAPGADATITDLALDVGALFALQPVAPAALRRLVGRCATAVPPSHALVSEHRARFRPPLTAPEECVLELYLCGMRRESIAAQMGISLSMTKVHVRRILDKAGRQRLTDIREFIRHNRPPRVRG